MKKPRPDPLLIVVCVYIAIITGIFLGRNMDPAFARISRVVSETPAPTDAPVQDNDGLININTANLEQLQTLPGIGPVLAQRIIDYRKENGPYETPLDLLNVYRIGGKKLSKILNLITTGG